jgi:transposase-like protein
MSELKSKNRSFSAAFKTRVVLELVRGDMSLSQASARYEVKDTVLSRWNKEFLERASLVFGGPGAESAQERRLSELEHLFKEQSLELAILKKALAISRKPKGGGS